MTELKFEWDLESAFIKTKGGSFYLLVTMGGLSLPYQASVAFREEGKNAFDGETTLATASSFRTGIEAKVWAESFLKSYLGEEAFNKLEDEWFMVEPEPAKLPEYTQLHNEKLLNMAQTLIKLLKEGKTRRIGTVEYPGFCTKRGKERIAMLESGGDAVLVFENKRESGPSTFSCYSYKSNGKSAAADVLKS